MIADQLDCEEDVVDKYSDRLLRLAGSRLPTAMRSRVDPSDIVQSAFRSFFQRQELGQFEYREVEDIWRLLASITFHKLQHSIRHHFRKMRDARRDEAGYEVIAATEVESPTASSLSIMQETLEAILSELPLTHRRVLNLRLEGYQIEDIAEQLRISTRTVNRGLNLARRVAERIVNSSEGN